ncbi:MAG: Metalloprotease TldD [candidate division WS2 bacterium]|uniref:Metalloprotease TldD n=1 Tax=Psychracetigena formicireducens TaxID=2986056 RepID=A0A9E2BGQ5_PSYF1|nr:Metalloprotease TldD [Candidatus Psychracetigena formicireducens]MBT9144246.1 Metalloprotease TldD [Candidatus Psychracetigena formicireducens]MBT9149908.1 Metalloprotease TldD [Candidatus Psychracetigena formicireducens]
MIGEKKLREIGLKALELAGKADLKVTILSTVSNLTRFARGEIHQNVSENNTELTLSYIQDQKMGISSTNDTSKLGVEKALSNARTIAQLMPVNPYLPDLPEPQIYHTVNSVSESTIKASPEDRAVIVGRAVQKAKARRVEAYGALTTEVLELCIMNTKGLKAYFPFTRSEFRIICLQEGGSGYGETVNAGLDKLDIIKISDEAITTCLNTLNPQSIEAGEYDVVIKPYATSDILQMLSYLSFNGKAAEEGRSYIKMKMGQQVASPLVTIYDDNQNHLGMPIPFDFEGLAKKKIPLIERGIAKGLVYDSFTAKKAGVEPTGHNLPATFAYYGALPSNLFMDAGEFSLEEMIKSVEKGVFVTRFHYTNPIDPVKAVITGMTRDGTFLIENGRTVKPIKNLRFTQSYFEALEKVEMVGKERSLIPLGFGASLVPALKIKGFKFTGVTEF